jgi:simple sugar transport system substrate-binding protein
MEECMKFAKLAVAGLAASALVLTACGGDSGSDTAAEGDSAPAAGSGDIKICMVTHGDGGGFWSVAKAGAVKAGDDLGAVTVDYQESNNDAEKQAQLIEAAVSGGCSGIIVSAPNPDAISGALQKATDAGIPVITMNSGSDVFRDLGAVTHVGQDEFIAGQEAGLMFQKDGAKKVLCPIQEQNNIGLQQRCDGAKDTFGNVENLQLSAGLADLSQSQAEIQAKLEADPEIDAVFALNADIATAAALPAAQAVGRPIIIGTVDLSGDAVQAIADGDIAFAIDQQQYAQGYLPVVLMYLDVINGHKLGGGQPIYTGPGFVTQDNAALVQELAAGGTR